MRLTVGDLESSGPETIPLAPLSNILATFDHQPGAVISLLERTQEAYGYLPPEVLTEISRCTRIPLHQLYGVATFYAQFKLHRGGRPRSPRGRLTQLN